MSLYLKETPEGSNINSRRLACHGNTSDPVLEVTPLVIAETQVRGLSRLVQRLTVTNTELQTEVRHSRRARALTAKLVKEKHKLIASIICLITTNTGLRKQLNEVNESMIEAHAEKEWVEAELDGVRENLKRLEKAEEEMANEVTKTREENKRMRDALQKAEKQTRDALQHAAARDWSMDIEVQGWQSTLKASHAGNVARILETVSNKPRRNRGERN